MAERMKSSMDSTDTLDCDKAIKRAIEAMEAVTPWHWYSQAAEDKVAMVRRLSALYANGRVVFPGVAKETALGTPVEGLPFRFPCALIAPDDIEEYTNEYVWPEAQAAWEEISRRRYAWEDGSVHAEPEPLALLPYCDSCYKPLMARRDAAMLAIVLACTTCGERQRITDCDREERLSEADSERLVEMLKGSQG